MNEQAGRKLSGLEGGIAIFVLTVTFKVSILPALLAQEIGTTAVWVLLLSVLADTGISLMCYAVARKGGVQNLPLPRWVKGIVGVVCAIVCIAKTSLYTYEVGSFAVGLLFDTGNYWVLSLAFLAVAGVLAMRGPRGVARTSIVFCALAGVLVVLTTFFVGQEGEGYHLFPLVRADGLGYGLMKQALWMGDGLVFLWVDMRDLSRKSRVWMPVSWVLSCLAVVGFYLVFFYTFGGSAGYIDHAFARTLMKESPHELGAVDWPIILMWLNAVPVVMGYHLGAAAEGIKQVVSKGKTPLLVGASTLLAGVTFALLFGDKNGTDHVTKPLVAILLWGLTALALLMAISGVLHEKSMQKAGQK